MDGPRQMLWPIQRELFIFLHFLPYGHYLNVCFPFDSTKADSQQRVPPVVLKKINPNGRLVSVAQTAATSTFSMANGRSPPVAVRQNLMSNCIDLTDEEDTSRQKVPRNSFGSGSHPPALVAFQGQSKQRSMITAQPKGAAQATRPAQKFG